MEDNPITTKTLLEVYALLEANKQKPPFMMGGIMVTADEPTWFGMPGEKMSLRESINKEWPW